MQGPRDRHAYAYAFAIAGPVLKAVAIGLDTCLYILYIKCRWRCHLPLPRSSEGE